MLTANAGLDKVHHDGSPLYVPDRSTRLGDVVPVLVRTARHSGVDRVWVRTTFDAEPRFAEAIPLTPGPHGDVWFQGVVLLRNRVNRYRFLLDGPAGYQWLTGAGVVPHDVPDDTDFRIICDDEPPAWGAESVIYLVFPDRFARPSVASTTPLPDWAVARGWNEGVHGQGPDRARELFRGDLDGLRERLDHVESLGATAVCLTPVFPAPANHRYCASSFDEIDPLLGGDRALRMLAEDVHHRGMRLIGDLTTNHTGDQHPWFHNAVNGKESDIYFIDPQTVHGYEAWVDVKRMPKLNWGSRELRRRMLDHPDGVVRRWLRAGLDGWRLDVANSTGRRAGDDLTHEVHRGVRAAMAQERPDALLIGEHAHDATLDVDQGGWHGTMSYAWFTKPVWSWLSTEPSEFLGVPTGVPRLPATAMLATMRAFTARMSWSARTTSWSLLDSHDTPRFRTLVGGDRALHEVGVGLMVALPGTPMVFAGDEVGLHGAYAEDSRRTMPWDDASRWDAATLRMFQELIRLRRNNPALVHGGLRVAWCDADRVAFWRETREQRLLVLAARAPGAVVLVEGAAGAVNVYGGAPDVADDGLLLSEGPTFQVWEVPLDPPVREALL